MVYDEIFKKYILKTYKLLDNSEENLILKKELKKILKNKYNDVYIKILNYEKSISIISTSSISENIKKQIEDFIYIEPKKEILINKLFFSLEMNEKFNLLLYGTAGSGKTQFIEYFINKNNDNCLKINTSDLISKKLGDTQKNIDNILHTQKKIIFLDELDSIVGDRNNEFEHNEIKRITLSMMKLMDENKDKIFISTTNIITNIDSALLRRFDSKEDFSFYKKTNINLYNALKNILLEHFEKNKIRNSETSSILNKIKNMEEFKNKKPYEIKNFFLALADFNLEKNNSLNPYHEFLGTKNLNKNEVLDLLKKNNIPASYFKFMYRKDDVYNE